MGEHQGPMDLAKLLETNAQAAPHNMFAIDTGEGPLIFRGGPITSVTKASRLSPLSRARARTAGKCARSKGTLHPISMSRN